MATSVAPYQGQPGYHYRYPARLAAKHTARGEPGPYPREVLKPLPPAESPAYQGRPTDPTRRPAPCASPPYLPPPPS